MSKLRSAADRNEDALSYQNKFERLASKAEADFEKSGKTKADAEAYMQQYFDDLLKVGQKKPELIIGFVKNCDARFPE